MIGLMISMTLVLPFPVSSARPQSSVIVFFLAAFIACLAAQPLLISSRKGRYCSVGGFKVEEALVTRGEFVFQMKIQKS
jgi:hypothetical protein